MTTTRNSMDSADASCLKLGMSRLLSVYARTPETLEDPDVDKFGNRVRWILIYIALLFNWQTYWQPLLIRNRPSVVTLYRETIRRRKALPKTRTLFHPEHRALLDKSSKPIVAICFTWISGIWDADLVPARESSTTRDGKRPQEQPYSGSFMCLDGNNSTVPMPKWMGRIKFPWVYVYQPWQMDAFQHIFNFTAIPTAYLSIRKAKVLQRDIYLMNKKQLTEIHKIIVLINIIVNVATYLIIFEGNCTLIRFLCKFSHTTGKLIC